MTKFIKPFISLLFFYLVVCTALRVVLLFNTRAEITLGEGLNIFLIGLVENVLVFFIAGIFLWAYLIFLSNGKFEKPFNYVMAGGLIALLLYLIFFNNIFKQYGSDVLKIVVAFVGLKSLFFFLMCWRPSWIKPIREGLYFFTLFLFVTVILLNAVSEYLFWEEFGVRYNFIAVDYLIYTNEVIGNIFESYPVVPLFTLLGLISLLISWLIFRRTKAFFDVIPVLFQKVKLSAIYFSILALGLFSLPRLFAKSFSENVYANELRADGLFKFYEAFSNSNLSYKEFYPVLDEKRAQQVLRNQLPGLDSQILSRNIISTGTELRKNIVLITIESLSADFMQQFGSTKGITPFLDSLADQGILFTNLFATGNRTVRGLEALTLCVPPSPGESIVKQKNNDNLFSVGSVLKQKGYSTTFFYGGYSYFDNMQKFYEGNGYKIVDRNSLKPNEISFANIWGACDEDMARKSIQEMNGMAKTGKPFFCQWLTVSNHRPFTYPAGKIDISEKDKSRDGGVKYTDYALRVFFNLASKQDWYRNTIFVVVADHCASSAGRVALPVEKYHIPAIVFAPDLLKPKKVSTLMSQIDLMPTVFGLLNFSYQSSFYGSNVFDSAFQPRTFLATYQSLGFIRDSVLTVLSPIRQTKQYKLIFSNKEGGNKISYDEVPLKTENQSLKEDAISYYQNASRKISK